MTYRIITDERYTGKAIYGKYRVAAVGSKKNVSVPKEDWVVCENAFEAIISKDTYIQAQKVLHKCSGVSHSQPKPRRKIRCGGCGRSMQRYDCKKPVFVCKTPFYVASPKCVQGQILESDIDEIVFDTIRRQIELFADNVKKRRDEADSSENTRSNILAQIQELQKSLQIFSQNRLSFYESYKDEKISREDYLCDRETLNSQIAEIEKQIQALELEFEQSISSTPKPIEQAYMQFAESAKTNEVIETNKVRLLTQEMIDCLVDSIIIYSGNKIEIKLKTADEFANIDNF